MTWDDFDYWQCGEWQVVQERLDDLDKSGTLYCPARRDLFRSLDTVPFNSVRVAIIGQDPYPSRAHATGIAFSCPKDTNPIPASLKNIFTELSNDYHDHSFLNHSPNLEGWCKQGILLWNVYPTCLVGSPGNHHWEEYTWLTKEIVERLDQRHIVFVFLGSIAKQYIQYVDISKYISCSHPSPLSASKGNNPFLGSRVFTTVNSLLAEEKEDPVDWRK